MRCEKEAIGGFLRFLKKNGYVWKVAVILLIGIILIAIGSGGSSENRDTLDEREKIEASIERICSSMKGVGKCRVMVSYAVSADRYSSERGRVESVVILCEGGGSDAIKKELVEMITALYGIGSNRIKIGVLD